MCPKTVIKYTAEYILVDVGLTMVKKSILEVLSRCGLAEPTIRMYDRIIGLPSDNDSFGTHNIPEIDIDITTDGDNGAIIFPYAHSAAHDAYLYSILASAFAYHGYQPIFILDDGALPITCNDNPNRISGNVSQELHKYTATEVLNQFGYDYYTISEFISDSSESIRFQNNVPKKYQNIELDKYAKSSTRKLLKKHQLRDKDMAIYDKFLTSGEILVSVYDQIISEFDPVCIISHDDKYNQGGLPLAVANDRDVHSYSLTFGWKDQSIIVGNISHQDSFPHYEEKSLVNSILDQPLSDKERRCIDGIMNDRANNTGDSRIHYSRNTETSIERSPSSINVGMFTNLIWDASLETDQSLFPNVFDWINDTIKSLSRERNINLFIKTHPAESILGTNESVYDWIRTNHSNNLDKLELLGPETNIDTYEMISDLDVGLVYNSTVGLEMAYYEKPVITAGDTHYRGLGITHDPNSSREYNQMINHLGSLSLSEHRAERAAKYLYYLFEAKHLHFPYITHEHDTLDLQPITTETIVGDEVLDEIVEKCIKGQPVLNPKFR